MLDFLVNKFSNNDTASETTSSSFDYIEMPSNNPRISLIERDTKETKVQVSLSLDGGPLDLLPESFDIPAHYPSQDASHHASQRSEERRVGKECPV